MTLTSFLEASQMALLSIGLVFFLLFLITVAVETLSKFSQKKNFSKDVPTSNHQEQFIDFDTASEEVQAGVLAAIIDYREQTKQNIRIISIKELKS